MRKTKTLIFTFLQPIFVCIGLGFAHSSAFAINILNDGPQELNNDEYSGYYLQNTEYQGAAIQKYLGERYKINEAEFNLISTWEAVESSCEAGYYLPKDSLNCDICISGNYCPGGKFAYDPDNSHGLNVCPDNIWSMAGAKDVSDCGAVMCEAGYYLPANSHICELCLEDKYCIGGALSVSDADSGIEECPDNLVAPTGTKTAEACGVKMAIGENTIYFAGIQETEVALVTEIAGKKYYAKASPVKEGIKPMNKDTTDNLILEIDGVEYSVYDNTVD